MKTCHGTRLAPPCTTMAMKSGVDIVVDGKGVVLPTSGDGGKGRAVGKGLPSDEGMR